MNAAMKQRIRRLQMKSDAGVETSGFYKSPGHKRMLWVALAMLVVSALVAPQAASAQAVYGSIFGTVTDASGAVVANATVTVSNPAKGVSVSAQSDASGEYRVQHLIPDTYNVTAEA